MAWSFAWASASDSAPAAQPLAQGVLSNVLRLGMHRVWFMDNPRPEKLHPNHLSGGQEAAPSMRGPDICLVPRNGERPAAAPQAGDSAPGSSNGACASNLVVKTANLPRACALLQARRTREATAARLRRRATGSRLPCRC